MRTRVRFDSRPETPPPPVGLPVTPAAVEWLAHGERGTSSNAIFTHMTGMDALRGRNNWTHPNDPDDLRRCLLLLEAVPEFKPHMHRMAEVSAAWAALASHWDEIVALYEADIKATPGWARNCYARMDALVESATAAASQEAHR
jgi:hypothetical protein